MIEDVSVEIFVGVSNDEELIEDIFVELFVGFSNGEELIEDGSGDKIIEEFSESIDMLKTVVSPNVTFFDSGTLLFGASSLRMPLCMSITALYFFKKSRPR